MPPGHMRPPGSLGDLAIGFRVMASRRVTREDVAKPSRERIAECVSRNTSPGAPRIVIVDIMVRRRVTWSLS